MGNNIFFFLIIKWHELWQGRVFDKLQLICIFGSCNIHSELSPVGQIVCDNYTAIWLIFCEYVDKGKHKNEQMFTENDQKKLKPR